VLFGTGLIEEEVLLCPSLILCNETYCTTLIVGGSIRNEGIIGLRYINRVNNYLNLKTLHVIVIKEI